MSQDNKTTHTFDLVVHRQSNRCMNVTITVEGESDPAQALRVAENRALQQALNTDFAQFSEDDVHYEIEES